MARNHITKSIFSSIFEACDSLRASFSANHANLWNCTYGNRRYLEKFRLKYKTNKMFDHVTVEDITVMRMWKIKEWIKNYPDQGCPISVLDKKRWELRLQIRVSKFMKRYPTIFKEFKGPKYNVPWFRLTDDALEKDREETTVLEAEEMRSVEKLCRILMMTKSQKLLLKDLDPWKWDLGLPYNYVRTVVPKYPNYLHFDYIPDRGPCLRLAKWRDEFAVSELQRRQEWKDKRAGENGLISLDDFVNEAPMSYKMTFPKSHSSMNKVKHWLLEWQRLPYISPYENVSHLDPDSHLMDKRTVGVFHELLSLTVHKRAGRDNILPFKYELLLPRNSTRFLTRFIGLFHVSMKCSYTTVTLKEGYRKGQLSYFHPLAKIRKEYYRMMTKDLKTEPGFRKIKIGRNKYRWSLESVPKLISGKERDEDIFATDDDDDDADDEYDNGGIPTGEEEED